MPAPENPRLVAAPGLDRQALTQEVRDVADRTAAAAELPVDDRDAAASRTMAEEQVVGAEVTVQQCSRGGGERMQQRFHVVAQARAGFQRSGRKVAGKGARKRRPLRSIRTHELILCPPSQSR